MFRLKAELHAILQTGKTGPLELKLRLKSNSNPNPAVETS
jgi:hypothetical protein